MSLRGGERTATNSTTGPDSVSSSRSRLAPSVAFSNGKIAITEGRQQRRGRNFTARDPAIDAPAMASVPLSTPSQAGLLVLPLPLLQPAVGACLRYRLPRLPPGLSSVRKGKLLPLPLRLLVPPRAVEGNDGRAVTKEGEEDTQERGGSGATKQEAARGSERFAADYVPLGIREPVYEVSGQQASQKSANVFSLIVHMLFHIPLLPASEHFLI